MSTLTVELKEASSQLAKRFQPSETAQDIDADSPQKHLVEFVDGEPAARCSIWYGTDGGAGLIGHYAATSAVAGRAVLNSACQELKKMGLTTVIGPVDGSTWKRYRLVTKTSSEKPFFMEPQNPSGWVDHFTGAGFAEIKSYGSSLNSELAGRDPCAVEVRESLKNLGVSIRSLSMDRLESDLINMHEITNQAFRSNFLYAPIAQATFIETYGKLAGIVVPDLVLIAEQNSEVVGFLLTVPDLSGDPETLVMKTIARKSDPTLKGLGRLLFDECHERASALGFRRAIHALYMRGNVAHSISNKYAEEFRIYSLFGRSL